MDIICVSHPKCQAAESQPTLSTPEKMRSPNMVSLLKCSPFKISFLLWRSAMDLEPKANIKYSLPITVLCVLSLSPFRVRLHVTETNSHPRMKLVPWWKNICWHVSFIPGWNEYNFIPGWNLIWMKNFHWVWKHIKKFIILLDMLKHQTITFLEK